MHYAASHQNAVLVNIAIVLNYYNYTNKLRNTHDRRFYLYLLMLKGKIIYNECPDTTNNQIFR